MNYILLVNHHDMQGRFIEFGVIVVYICTPNAECLVRL